MLCISDVLTPGKRWHEMVVAGEVVRHRHHRICVVERVAGLLGIDFPVAVDLGKVANAPGQAVGDPRGPPAAAGDLGPPFPVDGDASSLAERSTISVSSFIQKTICLIVFVTILSL